MGFTDYLWLRPIITAALAEDIEHGDLTTRLCVREDIECQARIFSREKGIVAGLEVAKAVFKEIEPELAVRLKVKEGNRVKENELVASLEGPARGILTAERTALNFLGRLSGIATLTSEFVNKVEGLGVKIFDTRKTTPGLRALEKYAVRVGGGYNHRFSLSDGILIKDNHLKVSGGIESAVELARSEGPCLLKIEVEVETIEEVDEAVSAGADVILLDNFTPEKLKEAVVLARQKNSHILLEASGGVTLETVDTVARSGVDMISIGHLTSSAKSMDYSLEID
ncbi:MAG: carboxylating nicotinate-nucleotide diphosphorylase [bacterium]